MLGAKEPEQKKGLVLNDALSKAWVGALGGVAAYQPLVLELLNYHELLLEVQVRLVLVGLLPEVVAGVLGLSDERGR